MEFLKIFVYNQENFRIYAQKCELTHPHVRESVHSTNSPPIPKIYHVHMVYAHEMNGIGWIIVGEVWLNV